MTHTNTLMRFFKKGIWDSWNISISTSWMSVLNLKSAQRPFSKRYKKLLKGEKKLLMVLWIWWQMSPSM